MKITSELLETVLQIENCPKFESKRISINSKDITGGEIFMAINRGHEFVGSALDSGAEIAIIDNEKYEISGKTILVKNTTEALKLIGKYIKDNACLKKVIGITGSVGKTSTRSWLNSILNNKFNSFSSIKNYNTIYGMPISLSLLEKEADFGIFEMGSSNPGEISELSKYLEPDIGVITNIYESHIGRFKNRDELADEKISIIDGIKSGGTLIFDGDSEFSKKINNSAIQKGLKTFSVGFSSDCDFAINSYGKSVEIKTPVGNVQYDISMLGKHFAYITACILAVIYAMNLDVFDFLPFFKNLSQVKGRGEILQYKFQNKKFSVIDDSYNASPSAVVASIEVLKSMPQKSKIAIIGQMKELGSHEVYYHKLVANKLNLMNLSHVFFIGDKNLWNIMNEEKNVMCFEKIDNFVIEKILEIIHNDSIVLLKGSRSIELNRFIDYIKCSIA